MTATAEFYKWTEAAHLLITLLLVFCASAQILATLFSCYRRPISRLRIFENLAELFILFQIIAISLLYGQVIGVYNAGIIAPAGYGAQRYIAAACTALISCVISVVVKRLYPLLIFAVSCLTLPVFESISGGAFARLYVFSLLFWLARGVYIGAMRYKAVRTSVSALSVKSAIDNMRTGIMFSSPDGFILLINEMMQRLMAVITGSIGRNARLFFDTLSSGELSGGCQRTVYEGQIVCLLPDDTAWMFAKTELKIKNKTYLQLTATEITEQWALTAQLIRQEEMLKLRGEEIKDTIANLYAISREGEIQRSKLRAHEILGRKMTMLLRVVRGEQAPDYDLLMEQSERLLDDFKQNQGETSPTDRIDGLRRAFETLGVEIRLDGEFPEDNVKGHILADVVSEGVTNAVHHGFATQVSVRISNSGGGCHLAISDNGFPPAGQFAEGGGIGGIRRAVENCGGVFRVAAHPRFVISADFPASELPAGKTAGGGIYV